MRPWFISLSLIEKIGYLLVLFPVACLFLGALMLILSGEGDHNWGKRNPTILDHLLGVTSIGLLGFVAIGFLVVGATFLTPFFLRLGFSGSWAYTISAVLSICITLVSITAFILWRSKPTRK
ncbi:MAG TPA: hypothetical protein VM821_01980 [Abditibacteriaceae bacterium]|jgi:hypothetical protein|nr:hypothetical protein [Abditibacteriaceae bacterium]